MSSAPQSLTAWPSEIRLAKDKASLALRFEDGRHYTLSAELLRVMSPSAEVRGHSAAERKTVGGKRHIRIQAVEPVGNYAVRLSFADGHATGIYTWPLLADLGADQVEIFAKYLEALAAKGLDRDRPGQI